MAIAYVVRLVQSNHHCSMNYGWKFDGPGPGMWSAEREVWKEPIWWGTRFATAGDAILRHVDYEAEDKSLESQRLTGNIFLVRVHPDGREETVGNLNELIGGVV